MRQLQLFKGTYRVDDFVDWAKRGQLELSPAFQRRSVWSDKAKSFFIDTLIRGLPVPLMFLRNRLDLQRNETIREVVDGQQRLRTLLQFVSPKALKGDDLTPLTLNRVHNAEYAGMTFADLPLDARRSILEYEFSVQVLPSDVEDREILEIFARLNATGTPLNAQELRNAEFHGAFKAATYRSAYGQLDLWLKWRLFSQEQVARMKEVELTADLFNLILNGVVAKRQARLTQLYRKYDDEFPEADVVAARFERTLDAIDELLGDCISDTVFVREIQFVTLFAFIYDKLYGLESELRTTRARIAASRLRPLRACLLQASEQVQNRTLPKEVLEAVTGASSDLRRRRARLDFLIDKCRGTSI